MKDCCLYTLVIGNNPFYKYSIENHKEYAKHIKADHIVQTEYKSVLQDQFSPPKIPKSRSCHPAYYEKICQIIELSKQYKRILFLDADIFVVPNSPSIFEKHPDPESNQFFGTIECMSFYTAVWRILHGIPEGKTLSQPIKTVQIGPQLSFPIFINAGMMLFGCHHPLLSLIQKEDLVTVSKQTYEIEQAYPSYLISENDLQFTDIGGQWNYLAYNRPMSCNKILPNPLGHKNSQLYFAKNEAHFYHCIDWKSYHLMWKKYYGQSISHIRLKKKIEKRQIFIILALFIFLYPILIALIVK